MMARLGECMTLIVCVDDKYGMAFHGRRQSMDRQLRERMLSILCGQTLRMSAYSAGQFEALPESVCIDDDFVKNAAITDACFLETQDPKLLIDMCDRIVLYRWNRVYPADLYFPISELDGKWTSVSKTDIAGYSHQQITEEIYEIK